MVIAGRFDIGKSILSAKPAIRLRAEHVIRQELDPFEILSQPGGKSRRGCYVVIGVVTPRRRGDANYHGTYSGGFPGILQDEFIGNAGEFYMRENIHVLNVKIDEIQMFEKLLQLFPLCVSACFQRRVYVALLALFEERSNEFMLHCGLAAADGDTAIRPTVERTVLVNLPEEFVNRHMGSDQFKGLIRTGFNTFAAACAEFPVNPRKILFGQRDRFYGTSLNTASALHALKLDVENLKGRLL